MTFWQWLEQQRKRNDPVGDLARDASRDKKFPRRGGERVAADYLRQIPVGPTTIQALSDAWDEFLLRRRAKEQAQRQAGQVERLRAALQAVLDAWETDDENGADLMEEAIYQHVMPALEEAPDVQP